jgi:aminopeptidase N
LIFVVQLVFTIIAESTDLVVLHSKEIVVKEASFVGSDKTIALLEICYNLEYTTVSFRFRESLPIGTGHLKITFDGILNGDMAGFYKSGCTDADGKKQIMASTQFEALDARRAFPCWDEPAMKATFGLTLIVPSELTALSNMPEVSTRHVAGGKKKVVFDASPKMSTYLLAWAVGQFDYVQGKTKHGVTIRVFSPPGRADHGVFALDVAQRSLDFYDDFFDEPYPLPKLDMICCTEFAMGAMENWYMHSPIAHNLHQYLITNNCSVLRHFRLCRGLVTYRETDLMVDAAKATSSQKQRVAIVVAHELAHQWFGNLVTMDWWNDLWLNEGFACYMEHFCADFLFPDYRIWEQYATDAMGAALRLDSLKSSHPIQVPIVRAEEVEQVSE